MSVSSPLSAEWSSRGALRVSSEPGQPPKVLPEPEVLGPLDVESAARAIQLRPGFWGAGPGKFFPLKQNESESC